jgi:hypothetical protein
VPRPYRLSQRVVRAWGIFAVVVGASRGLLAADAGDIAASTGYDHADPTRDPRVGTLLSQQALAARRNADAQIGNVHGRLLQLHGDDAAFCDPPERPPARRSTAGESAGAPGSDSTTPAASPAAAPVGSGITLPSVPSTAPPVTLPLNACRRSSVATAWTAGAVVVGPSTAPEGPTFGLHSGGVTLGADRRIASNVVLGVGIGLARERAEAVGDGVRNGVEAQSAVVYLGYRPTPSLTIDAVAGQADLQMRSARRIGERTLSLAVDRPAAQRFASIAAGYRLDVAGTALAPYTRLDAQQATLQAAAEADGNGDALQYQRQDAPSLKLALGIEASSRIETRYGALSPRGKVEMRHELERTGAASIAYADGPAGASYAVDATAVQRTAWSAGFGAALGLRDDWSVGAVYGFDRSGGSGGSRLDVTLTRRLR